ncbi:phage tail protein [Leminorella grimontii]|uniref:phage tail-collar fiber domain-containing protein n=1 Tax=Leminorella grimontii TaxID=82981 RepID=UPI003220094B
MKTFYTILTNYGKQALADALAAQQPLKIPAMGAGDGGGAYYEPTDDQTNLRNELWRGNLNDLRTDDDNQNNVIAEAVIPQDIDGDWVVREVGLYDDKGGLIAVGKYPETYIPALAFGSAKQVYINIVVKVDNVAAVELVVDHDTVLASKQFVMNKGYGTVGSFEAGLFEIKALTNQFQLVIFESENSLYRWDGAFPKTVPTGSTPDSTGGIGQGAWIGISDAALRKDLANGNGSLIGTNIGTLDEAITFVTPEMFGAIGDGVADDTQAILDAIQYVLPKHMDVIGYQTYKISNTLEIRETANLPPELEDFSVTKLKLQKLIYTPSSGTAVRVKSPACQIIIGHLVGTSTEIIGLDQTIGLEVAGMGCSPHYINYIGGFGTNIKFSDAYTNEVHVGWCHDAFRGVRGVNSNANKIYGRIGGPYGTVDIIPSSCDVGVEWDSTSNTNEVYATIEYCKRSVYSKPFEDHGLANKFYGYIEACSQPGVLMGTENKYQVMNGGNTTRGPYGFLVSGAGNSYEILLSRATYGENVTGATATLTFKNLQPIQSTNNHAKVFGSGHKEILSSPTINQLLVYSNDLGNSAWYKGVLGSASLSDLTFTYGNYNSNSSNGYAYGTKINISRAATSEADIYVISQNVTTTFSSDLSLGIAVQVLTGDVDVFIKAQGVTSGKIYSKEIRLLGGSKIVELSHSSPSAYGLTEQTVYEIELRAWSASSLIVYNTHLCAAAQVTRAPASIGDTATPFTPIYDSGYVSRRSISKFIGVPTTMTQYDFDTYLVYAMDGNISLFGGYDGLTVTFHKPGISNTNLLSAEPYGINGSGLYSISANNKTVTLQYSVNAQGWIVISSTN